MVWVWVGAWWEGAGRSRGRTVTTRIYCVKKNLFAIKEEQNKARNGAIY